MTRHYTLPALAAALLLASTPPAHAQDSMTEATTRIVRYDDLNLMHERGRERLETRLRSAAGAACGLNGARELSERIRARKCREQALEDARPKMEQAVRSAAKEQAKRGN